MLIDSIFFAKGESVIRWKIFRKFLALSSEDIVMDVGSGDGFWARKIAPWAKLIVLVDVDRKQITKAKARTKYYNSFFVVADAMHLPFEKLSFDKILSNQVLEHLTHPKNALLEMSRVLKRNGILVISTVNSSVLEKHVFFLTKILQNILPSKIVKWASSYIIGDFVKFGYNGWSMRVGHLTKGFHPMELDGSSFSKELASVGHAYLHKRNALLFWEFRYCLPLLSVLLRPIEYIVYLLENRDDSIGLDIIVKYQKCAGENFDQQDQ